MSDELPTAARVSDPGIRALYKQENRWQAWLDVEVALARAQAELGIIPKEAADAIARAARLDLLGRKRIDEGFARTGHTIVPLVWELARVVGEPHGGWVHWGATTQNITQTGDLLVLRQAHHIFLRLIGDALLAAADLAERGADMPIPGRTHGQHALPATFGYKPAVWIDEVIRHVERFRQAAPRVFVAMLGGGAGTFASLGKDGPAVQAGLGRHLGMPPMTIPSRRLVEVLRGLRLDPERMRQNLDLGGGLIMAEAVMLNLGQTIGRQHAHDVVYDAAQAAFVEGKSFGMLLAADPRVTAHLSVQQIEALLDPAGYTGLCAEMARDATARARTLAGEVSDVWSTCTTDAAIS